MQSETHQGEVEKVCNSSSSSSSSRRRRRRGGGGGGGGGGGSSSSCCSCGRRRSRCCVDFLLLHLLSQRCDYALAVNTISATAIHIARTTNTNLMFILQIVLLGFFCCGVLLSWCLGRQGATCGVAASAASAARVPANV